MTGQGRLFCVSSVQAVFLTFFFCVNVFLKKKGRACGQHAMLSPDNFLLCGLGTDQARCL